MTNRTADPRLNEISSSLFRVAAKAVIIHDHQILLVKEFDDEWWGLPGGGIEHHETPLEGLKRELVEELGVNPARIESDGQVLFATSGSVVGGIPRANVFCRATVPLDEIRTTSDVEKVGWFSAEELTKTYLSPSGGDITAQLLPLLK